MTEDKYGRTLGELSFNGENIQELLVKEAHAEIYKKILKTLQMDILNKLNIIHLREF